MGTQVRNGLSSRILLTSKLKHMKNVQKHFQNFSADSKSEDSVLTHSQILPIFIFFWGGNGGALQSRWQHDGGIRQEQT